MAELEREIRRTFEPKSFQTIREDKKVAPAAWDGVRVPRSAFRKVVAQLAESVVAAPVGVA